MFQQIIALIIIAFFITRLFYQRQKKQVSRNEFLFWLLFWFVAGIAILFLKWIDNFVVKLGFSSSGIDILLYLGVVMLFYLIFRLRLKLEKQEKNITKIVRYLAIHNKK